MKKVFCIFFAALFVFSALNLTVFAVPETELVAEPETAAEEEINESLVKYSIRQYPNGQVNLRLGQGETVTLNYLKLDFGTNVPVPKGGKIVWTRLDGGGDVTCKVSKDKKTCTVTGVKGGHVAIGAYVFDAASNKLSGASENICVRYTGFLEILETITFGVVSVIPECYYIFLALIGLNPEVVIG